uniref:Uncharacterized protein n=1 Tax=Tanacetum cinerariifolium TaxID=118510 RepID=A0A6L2MI03_TANCI|nr:hypothetical protein [Tanacetum cinerariifolium]
MSSITTQQAKLDLELVPKEKRLEIGKCNRRLNPGKIQREPTFQVVLDYLALTPCYSAFLITQEDPEVYMHQFWDSIYKHDTFHIFKMDKRNRFKLNLEIFIDIFKICPRVQGQDFDALPTDEEIVSFLRELRHTGEIIHSMMLLIICINRGGLLLLSLAKVYLERQLVLTSFISLEHKSFGVYTIRRMWTMLNYFGKISFTRLTTKPTKSKRRCTTLSLPKLSFTIFLLKTRHSLGETRLGCTPPGMTTYQTYLGFATRATPTKKVKKFKKPASPKLNTVLVLTKTPTKGQRVKRHVKKSTETLARGVVIRETFEMPLTKKKEKLDVTLGTGVKPGVRKVAEEESSKSEAESWRNDEDDSNNEQVLSDEDNNQEKDNDDDKTLSDNKVESDSEHETDESESGSEFDHDESEENEEDVDDEDETKIIDKAEGDEDEEMDYTTSQLYDDVDIRLNEPIDTEKGFVQEEGINAVMTNVQQGNENPDILQVIEDAHVTLSIVPQKTEVPVTSSSHSSELATKFLNFSDIPHTYAEIVSPMDVHVHHKNIGKTLQQGQNQSWLMTLASFAEKPSKTFDELMGTPIDIFAFIMNGLNINNFTQEILLGPVFRLLKGTRSNYVELEYDFEECYKALLEKIDWENPEGSDYPFDLTKPLPLVMIGNRQNVPVDYFFNNDLKYLQGGILTMTYTTSQTKTKAAQYDLSGIEDMFPNMWSHVKDAYDKHALWGISH